VGLSAGTLARPLVERKAEGIQYCSPLQRYITYKQIHMSSAVTASEGAVWSSRESQLGAGTVLPRCWLHKQIWQLDRSGNMPYHLRNSMYGNSSAGRAAFSVAPALQPGQGLAPRRYGCVWGSQSDTLYDGSPPDLDQWHERTRVSRDEYRSTERRSWGRRILPARV
jgi:hypothetical protein